MCELGHILTLLDQTNNNSSKWEKGIKKWVGLISISSEPLQFNRAHGPMVPFEGTWCVKGIVAGKGVQATQHLLLETVQR